MLASALKRLLTFHWLGTLLLMTLLALVFGLATLNLVGLAQANLSLIARHGAMALIDGALRQFAEIAACGVVASVSYVLIKACEKVLVSRILD